ncbi:hypothetical protein MCOR33_011138 [Pyricularia grisea]|uniref:t-SNARE coiled-coil homology domain-containing protein n=1 Tax=Pyricularia grisea TaxID=148305 RepID=A0ABQ8N481_PYRGI|nr:hypothetical protein MCOR33_011138 [Pyricularia grisea]
MVEGCQTIARDASLPNTPPASASGCSHRDSPHLSPGSDPGCCCIAICGTRSWLIWINAGRESRFGDVTQIDTYGIIGIGLPSRRFCWKRTKTTDQSHPSITAMFPSYHQSHSNYPASGAGVQNPPQRVVRRRTAQIPQGSQGQEIKTIISDINEVRTMIGGLTNQLQGVLDIVRKVEQSQESLEQDQETFKQMQEKMKQGLTELTESFEIHDVEVAQDQGATKLGFLSGSSLFRKTTNI